MWLVLIILLSTRSTKSSSSTEKEGCIDIQFRSTGANLVSSFEKFRNDLQSFFRLNIRKFERRRKLIQVAFFKFVKEAFGNNGEQKTSVSNFNKEERFQSNVLMEEFVKSHGYRTETHTVVTTDGYVLNLHRILPSSVNESASKIGVVLLHHGLLGSSEDWILLGPKKSLPYILVNSNFDVWLANARGNKYSRGHTSQTISEDEFWNYSFHEIGKFDLSAIIDYIRDQTDKTLPFNYIGHSMGCTVLLTLLSIYPSYNYILNTAIFLAPLAFMNGVKGPMLLLAEFYEQNLFITSKFLGVHDFIPLEYFPKSFIGKFCKGDETMCSNPLLLLANGGQEVSNETLRQNILKHVPAGGSMKTILHYVQLVKSGQFQMFDMGKFKNAKIYDSASPPNYNLNETTLPLVLFTSSDDWLSTVSDVQSLVSHLPNPILHHIVRRNDFSHTDFVWGEDADILVYYLVLDVLKRIDELKKT